MQMIWEPFSNSVYSGFPVGVCEEIVNWYQAVISFRCDISKETDMFLWKHTESIPPCIWCLTSKQNRIEVMQYIICRGKNVELVHCENANLFAKSSILTKIGRKRVSQEKVYICSAHLNLYLLKQSRWYEFIIKFPKEALKNHEYLVFTVDPLHPLHLGVFKNLKKCTIWYSSSSNKCTVPIECTRCLQRVLYCARHNSWTFPISFYAPVREPLLFLESMLTVQKPRRLLGWKGSTSIDAKFKLEGKD